MNSYANELNLKDSHTQATLRAYDEAAGEYKKAVENCDLCNVTNWLVEMEELDRALQEQGEL